MAHDPSDVAVALLDAMNGVAALQELHMATSRLQIEQAYPTSRDYLAVKEFQRRHDILTSSQIGQEAADLATAALSGVAEDFEKLEGIRQEVIGSLMNGWLGEPYGVPALELALHEWLSSADIGGLSDLANRVHTEASRLQARRTRPSPGEMKRYKQEVQRLIDRLRAQVPEHVSQVVEWIRQDYVGDQVNYKSLAVIACATAGVELLSDRWVTEFCYTLRDGNPVVAVMACDNPLARDDKLGIMQQAIVGDGDAIRGLITGDMWLEQVLLRESFGESQGTYEQYRGEIDESAVVMGQWAFLPKCNRVTDEEISYLYCMRQGFSDVVDRLYDGLFQCAVSCAPPEGRCSGTVVLWALKRMEEDVPSLFADFGIGWGLNVRSIAALFSASSDKVEFGGRIARRMVGCLSTDCLCIIHRYGQLSLTQVGADLVVSGPKAENSGATEWFMAELQTLAGSRGVSWCGGNRPHVKTHEDGYVLDRKYGASVHELWRRHCFQVIEEHEEDEEDPVDIE